MALQNGIRAGMSGDDQLAVQFFRQAVAAASRSPEAHFNLGTALKKIGEAAAALKHLERAVALAPDFMPARVNLGNLLLGLGRHKDACTHLSLAAELVPKANTLTSLAMALMAERRLDEAERALTAALKLEPRAPHAWNALGTLAQRQGRALDAVAHFRNALAIRPDLASAHSNLVQGLCFVPGVKPEDVLEAAQAFGVFCGHVPEVPSKRSCAGGRLRIGYCSADLYTHPVGFFWAPVIVAHDRERYEVFVYDDGARTDHITATVRARADHWRYTRPLDDTGLANLIRRDGIDVLIDLSGHSGNNRLMALARRLARLQGVAGGHFSTTGMASVDFLVADRWHVPPGAEAGFSESLLHLPNGYVCYRPPAYAPAVAPLPAAASGVVTFAVFNRLAKITDEALAAWGRILERVPGSRLLLAGMEEGSSRQRLVERFATNGVDETRLSLEGQKSHAELLATYNRVDVALDTFPYSGGLTTCEALWMGVPVVTLAGELFSGRHSLSHLSNVGLSELAADDLEGYVQVAVSLGTDLARLAGLRDGLRARVAASPLCDADGHAQTFEAALMALWGDS